MAYDPGNGAPVEIGRVSGQPNEDELFVVFACNGRWDKYLDFTGQVTPIAKVTVLGDAPIRYATGIMQAAFERMWFEGDPFEGKTPPLPDFILPPVIADLRLYQDEPWEPDHSDDRTFAGWKLPIWQDSVIWLCWNADDGWSLTLDGTGMTTDAVSDAHDIMYAARMELDNYPDGPDREPGPLTGPPEDDETDGAH